MPKFIAISKEIHASKRWKRIGNYSFAAKDNVVPLVLQELPYALMHLPTGFIQLQKKFVPVAILGLHPGQNLFVAPDGRWIGGYIPAAYRGYPFRLAETTDGQRILVIDEDSGFITDTDGEPFFDDDGNPAHSLKGILDFLIQAHANQEPTQHICEVLTEHQLIKPWTINLQDRERERKVEGLYCIDETAMNALPSDAFETLRKAGALSAAYCQLLSMQHIQIVRQLAQAQVHVQTQTATKLSNNQNAESAILNNDIINFDNL